MRTLLACALAALSLESSLQAEIMVKTEVPATPSDQAFAPDVEAKFQKLIAGAKIEKARLWNQRMTDEIAEVAKITGLNAAGQKALEEPAKAAVAASIASWSDNFEKMLRTQLHHLPPAMLGNVFDRDLNQMTMMVQSPIATFGDTTQPIEEDGWTKALHQTLSPAQFATWDAKQTAEKALLEKQTATILTRQQDQARLQLTQQMMAECKNIETQAALPPDRASKLEDLAKTVVDQRVEEWKKGVQRIFLGMTDAQRSAFSGGQMFLGSGLTETPAEQPAWKNGVALLLTGEEKSRLATARDGLAARWTHVVGQITLALLDEKVALTGAQRRQLEPMTDEMAQGVAGINPVPVGNFNPNYFPQQFLSGAAKVDEAKLKLILDDRQLQRWKEAVAQSAAPLLMPPKVESGKPAASQEPEDMEETISNYLFAKAEKIRADTVEANALKVEDIVRSAGLDARVTARLQAAARGAAENYMATWSWFSEQQIRANLQDATPQNVQQKLDSLQGVFFQQNFGMQNNANRPDVWSATVKLELNARQQDSWRQETDARAGFHDQAVADWVIGQFDQQFQLTSDQRAKLEPLVTGILHDYSPDIMQVFSGSNQMPWFLEGVYVFLPMAGLPDTELSGTLTKDQLDRWRASPGFANANNLWQNIRQIHQQRANAPKP